MPRRFGGARRPGTEGFANIPRGTESVRTRFEDLCEKHAEKARRLVRLRLGSQLRRRLDSEDVLQEALLEASRLASSGGGGAFEDDAQFLAWLSAIIDNKIRNLVRYHVETEQRSVRREASSARSGELRLQPAGDLTPSGVHIATETWASVLRALEKLSPKEREVITLVHLRRMRVAEAAREMGKTANSTSVLLHHALRRLAEVLGQERP